MQFSRVPRFIPLWLKQTTVSLFAHLKAGFVDDLGSLRGKHVVNFLTCFYSLWGHQKKPVEIIPSSYLGIQAWKIFRPGKNRARIETCNHRFWHPQSWNHLPRWCWIMFLVCFRRENTHVDRQMNSDQILSLLSFVSSKYIQLMGPTQDVNFRTGKENNALIAPLDCTSSREFIECISLFVYCLVNVHRGWRG